MNYWSDVMAHYMIELMASAMGWAIYSACPHRWHRWARFAITVGMDFLFAMVCVKVIG